MSTNDAKKPEVIRDERGVSLLKKRRSGLLGILFSPMGVVLLLLALGIVIIVTVMLWLTDFLVQSVVVGLLIQIVAIVYILNSDSDATSKMAWLLVITVFPIIGVMFYIFINSNLGMRTMKKRANQLVNENLHAVRQDKKVVEQVRKEDVGTMQVASYMADNGCHPICANTTVKYYPLGEQKWADLLEDMKKAEKFIFLEYFIVEEGLMWGKMLEIMEEKAAKGVDVRFIYDGTCEFVLVPRNYPKLLAGIGIKAKPFARLMPLVSSSYNYRNHRKIAVIDGKVAYTGGVNLSDEYINAKEVFGHWKDTAVRLEGPAVDPYTLLFLEDWCLEEEEYTPVDRSFLGKSVPQQANGYVIPLGESPLDDERCAENVYIDFLNRAKKYVYIMSPYLILDGELENALCFAARRGVDVRLVMPGVPDKAAVYWLAWTYFHKLTQAGVKIFTYTPGFVHAKVFLSDDERAFVGTINLDYRSLYHHFECGAYLYKTDCIADIKADFVDTLSKCELVTEERIEKRSLPSKIIGPLARIIAPLL